MKDVYKYFFVLDTHTNVNKENDNEFFRSEIDINIKKESCEDDIDEYETQFDKFQYNEINIKTENSTENISENNASSSSTGNFLNWL